MTQIKNFPFSLKVPELLKTLENHKTLTLVNVGNAMAKSFLLSELVRQSKFKNIFWASTDEKAEGLHLNAEIFLGENIIFIPNRLSMKQFYTLKKRITDNQTSLFLFEDFEIIITQKFPSTKVIKQESLNLLC